MRPWRSWIARVTPTHKAAGSNPVGRTSSEIPAAVPFPASPKTALWWGFLRFPPRLASLDSRWKGNVGTRGGRKIDFDRLLHVNNPAQSEQIVVNCSGWAGSFFPVALVFQGLQAFSTPDAMCHRQGANSTKHVIRGIRTPNITDVNLRPCSSTLSLLLDMASGSSTYDVDVDNCKI